MIRITYGESRADLTHCIDCFSCVGGTEFTYYSVSIAESLFVQYDECFVVWIRTIGLLISE